MAPDLRRGMRTYENVEHHTLKFMLHDGQLVITSDIDHSQDVEAKRRLLSVCKTQLWLLEGGDYFTTIIFNPVGKCLCVEDERLPSGDPQLGPNLIQSLKDLMEKLHLYELEPAPELQWWDA